MSQERNEIDVSTDQRGIPKSKLKAALGRLSEDESKEAVQLEVKEGLKLFFCHQIRTSRVPLFDWLKW